MFLGLDDSWESRTIDLCKAELEQAHGRLRAVHRRAPAEPSIGNVRPSGWGWAHGEVNVREVKRGRRPKAIDMTSREFADVVDQLGGVTAAAELLGRSPSTVSLYKSGKQRVSTKIAVKARGFLADQRL